RADAAAAPQRPDHHPGHPRRGRGRGRGTGGPDAGRADRGFRAGHRRGRRHRGTMSMDPAVPARANGWTRQAAPGWLGLAATVIVAAAGLRVSGLGVIDAAGFALALAWAIAGLIVARSAARSADRTAAWLIALGALAGTVGLTAARIGASEGDARGPARVLATLAACGVIAVSFHYLLALPDGRLGRPGRRILAGLGYASAAGVSIGLIVAGQPFTLMAGAVIWPIAVACALPFTRLRYRHAAGRDKERLQWLGAGLVIAAGAALVVPLAVIAAEFPPLARYGGRVFVQALAVAGSGAVVAAIYLVIVLGLGNAPGNPEDRRILGLSML